MLHEDPPTGAQQPPVPASAPDHGWLPHASGTGKCLSGYGCAFGIVQPIVPAEPYPAIGAAPLGAPAGVRLHAAKAAGRRRCSIVCLRHDASFHYTPDSGWHGFRGDQGPLTQYNHYHGWHECTSSGSTSSQSGRMLFGIGRSMQHRDMSSRRNWLSSASSAFLPMSTWRHPGGLDFTAFPTSPPAVRDRRGPATRPSYRSRSGSNPCRSSSGF